LVRSDTLNSVPEYSRNDLVYVLIQAGRSEADLALSGVLQPFGGTAEIRKEIITRSLGLYN
jgi:hypothetical protein